jgi:hypothetical protein
VNATLSALIANMAGVIKDSLAPHTEFWTAHKTLNFLAQGKYFRDQKSGNVNWPPESLQGLLSKSKESRIHSITSYNPHMYWSLGDSLGLTSAEGWELGLR